MQTTATSSSFLPQNSPPTSEDVVRSSNGSEIATHVPRLISPTTHPVGQNVFLAQGISGYSAVPQRGDQLDGIAQDIINFLYRHPHVSVDAVPRVLTLCMERIRRDLAASASIPLAMNHGLSAPSDGSDSSLSYPIQSVYTRTWPFVPELAPHPDVSDIVTPPCSALSLSHQIPQSLTRHVGETQVPSDGRSFVNPTEHPHLPRGFNDPRQAVEAQPSSFTIPPPGSERQIEHLPPTFPTQDVGRYPTNPLNLPITARRGRRVRHGTGPRTACPQCNLTMSAHSLRRHVGERHEGKKRKPSRKKASHHIA
ncbi:hypothetical protein F5I97DRAFT_829855 [Phlebopus sp. FC_14]|nr:hypothetical protein F5I97DRAFT_829855 [Phlebopus sp. FC_14]